ncbi:MAG: phosphatidylcholine/phosphatidylserine synthase, partial [Holosporales bacterium]|nr:phosphatidylcholine/phosphatidylserine synthase [Holosporales bacterium]
NRWEEAVLCILVAAILDSMDGRLARLLKCANYFGSELDSLADVISFGVSPALILYFWTLQSLGNTGWGVCLFFCACCALRLARFNSTTTQTPHWATAFFTGVPAPAGALIALFPLVLSLCYTEPWVRNPAFSLYMLVSAGLLKISRLPTFSFKKVKISSRQVFPLLVILSLVIIGLITEVWTTLALLALIYLATIPYSCIVYARLERQHKPAPSEGLQKQETLF